MIAALIAITLISLAAIAMSRAAHRESQRAQAAGDRAQAALARIEAVVAVRAAKAVPRGPDEPVQVDAEGYVVEPSSYWTNLSAPTVITAIGAPHADSAA